MSAQHGTGDYQAWIEHEAAQWRRDAKREREARFLPADEQRWDTCQTTHEQPPDPYGG